MVTWAGERVVKHGETGESTKKGPQRVTKPLRVGSVGPMIPVRLLVNLAEFSEGEADCLHGVGVPLVTLGILCDVSAIGCLVVGGGPTKVLDGNPLGLGALFECLLDCVCYGVVGRCIVHDDKVSGLRWDVNW